MGSNHPRHLRWGRYAYAPVRMLPRNKICKKVDAMNHVRGFLMLLAAGFAVWRGWKIHTGMYAWMAYGLAAAALALAVWHLTRKPEARRM